MNQKERKKVLDERAKLKGYRNRLMLLKDAVPNINELWGDNKKMMEFFESGKAQKYEDHLSIKHGKPIDKLREVEFKTVLTVDLFKELKTKGVNDRTIMEDFKLNSNQLNAWKKKNGVLGMRLEGGKPAHKKVSEKGDVEMAKVTAEIKVDGMEEVQNLLQEAKSKIEALEKEKRKLSIL